MPLVDVVETKTAPSGRSWVLFLECGHCVLERKRKDIMRPSEYKAPPRRARCRECTAKELERAIEELEEIAEELERRGI